MPKRWDLEENWNAFERLARSGAEARPDIVCTPETFLEGYVASLPECDGERLRRVAQPVDGEYVGMVRSLAAELGTASVTGPLADRRPDLYGELTVAGSKVFDHPQKGNLRRGGKH